MRTFWTLLLTFVSLRSGEGLQSCPAPPQYQHLNVTLDEMFRGRQWFRSGDKVSYDCAQDFTPIDGSHYVLCTDGLWNKLSLRCRKKSCGRVSDLPNGEFRYEGEPFIGAKVYAVCDKGYKCKGLNYTICQRSGWTGKFPSCVAEGETTCSTPTVANSVQPEVSVHQPGDNLTVTCDQGFQLVGEQLITCGADGQWEPLPPQCLLTPNVTTAPPGSCGMPSKFYNGNAELDEKYITKTFFSSGDKVYYTCPVGYKPAGGSISRRCEDGEWSPLKMTCERRLCGSAGQILNGQFMYSGVQFGDTATAVCDEGYILVGKATRRCRSEGWDGRVPECEDVVCEDPPEVENAEIKGLYDVPLTYRSVVRYHCHVGFIIGHKELWCTKDGTWSGPPPVCKEIICKPPNVPYAYWEVRENPFQFGDTIWIRCHEGYRQSGPSTLRCNKNGKWEPALPKCLHLSRRTTWRSYV